MTRTLRMDIDSRPECIELLSNALHDICHLTLPVVEIARINLAMVEAVNNAVEHAYHGESGHPVWVEFDLTPDHFRLRVCDQGQPMAPGRLAATPELAEPDPEDPATWSARGRGLAIIKSCMDTVEYQVQDGINTLTMRRNLITHEPPLGQSL